MNQQVTQLYQPLLGYVKKRINNLEDAEDLTQEVFLKLSKSDISQVKSVKNWVYTIAKNSITDYYRKKKTPVAELGEMAIADEHTPDDPGAELSNCVTHFLNQLPKEYREIMMLSEIEGMPQKEIAEKLGINYVTVRSKVQRGRKKLKGLFSDCCDVIQGGKGSILEVQPRNNCGDQKCDGDKKC